jgi:sialidase-1
MSFAHRLLLLSILACCQLQAQISQATYLFKNRTNGYGVYRIPTIIKTKSGKLLAFCEGRQSLFDHGNIDLVMKSSIDNGLTWSKLSVVWNDGANTCGNPSPVIDAISGDVILLATLNNNNVFVLRSKNEGETWETPLDISSSVKDKDWRWYATGPVHAIQLASEQYKNRIIVPCNHTVEGEGPHISHVIYSDDNGKTWNKGGCVAEKGTDECTVVELKSGFLMLNMRNSDRVLPCRKVCISSDGGNTWSRASFDTTLIEPICEGTLLSYEDVILFANPSHKSKRKNLTLRSSSDEGKTWIKYVIVHKGKSAYNDIVKLNNGDILCLYETGKVLPYSGIVLKIIPSEMIIP